MAAPRSQLISLLIRKKLYQEVDQILSILRQGFDVHVKSQFSEVERLLINFLEQEILANPTEFRLVLDPSLIGSEQESIEIEEQGIKPTVLVSSENLEKGFGFVQLNVRAPDYLIGSVASAIETILEHFSLTVYLDIFDSNILTRLKQIARMFGLCVLIDAVIQTAYLGGFHGDANMVLRYLEGLQSEGIDLNKKNEISLEKCAEMFFAYVVHRGENAHSFLKSSFSYYAVNLQGISMSKASQLLRISRTTLQEHLKIADQLGVSHFFEGCRQKTI